MLSPLRVGIVGTGFGARVVAPAFAAVDGCTVVDVVSARIVVRNADGSRGEHHRSAAAPADDLHTEPMQRFAGIVCAAVRAGHTPAGTPTFADGLACARIVDDLRG